MGAPQNHRASSRTAAREAGSTAPAPHSIPLSDGRNALAVFAPADVPGEDAVASLGLTRPRGVIVLNGGTAELSDGLGATLRRSLGDGVARVALEERLTVVTGGTDAGIFSVFGQALGDAPTAPCIGVVPAGRVTWPGRTGATVAPGEEERVPLEPHHSHFLLVAGDEWGVETEAMLSLCQALSLDRASLALLAGGGTGARREVLGHVRAGREVIVLAGTGRFADELAGVIVGGSAPEPETAEIAARGLVTVVDGTGHGSELGELVRARLALGEETARR